MNTWILIADAARARIFQFDPPRRLRLVKEMEHAAGRARAQDLVSDEAGRMDSSRSPRAKSAMDPRTSPHEVELQRFARELSRTLREGLRQHATDAIALVAPAHFLGLLRHELDDESTKAMLAHHVADLSAIAERDLPEHLIEFFESIQRVVNTR